MASDDIEIRIQAAVDSVDAAKSLGDLKKSIKELNGLAVEFGDSNEDAFRRVTAAAGAATDRVNDVKAVTKSLSGEPIENLSSAFSGLKSSITSLDIDGFKNQFGALKTSFGELGGGVLSSLRTSLSTTSGSFKLLGGAIAATGIGALVIGVIALIQNFDTLQKSGGLIGKVFTYIGDVIKKVTGYFKDFLDYIGLTDFKGTEAAENFKKNKEKEEEAAEKKAKADKKILEEQEKLDDKAKAEYLRRLEEKKKAEEQYNATIARLQDAHYLDSREKLIKSIQDELNLITGKSQEEQNLRAKIAMDGQAALDAFDQDIINKKTLEKEAAKEKERQDLEAAREEAAANREIDLGLQNDYNLTLEQIDLAFEEAQRQNANITYEQFDELYRKDNETLKKKYEEDAANQKKAQEDKNKQVQAGFNLASSLTNAISAIGDLVAAAQSRRGKLGYKESVEVARKQFNLNKGLQITNAGIQTAQAVIAAYSSGAAVPIAGVALGPIMAAIAGVAGAAQIGAIAAKKFTPESPPASDSGAASVDAGAGTAALAAAIPSASSGTGPVQAAFQASSFFGLGQNNLNGSTTGGQQVYVVETDITNTQNRVRTIENRADLGG